MQSYEAICIFHPELKDERIDSILKKFEDKIKSKGGKVEEIKKWGLRKLAFTFKKDKNVKDGFFVLMNFKGEGNVPLELQNQMKVTEDIIRYMISRALPEEALAQIEAGKEKKVEIDPSMLIKQETKPKE